MGRVRTLAIKSVSQQLVELYADKFTDDFEHNKKVVDQLTEIPSRKVRNKIAGYITHLVKLEKKELKKAEKFLNAS
ncbi:MAG: 30S ribosomal protein S17e [Candidatus Odinarchaeia archaeon]